MAKIGDILLIEWVSQDWLDPDGNSLSVKIELSRNGGSVWETIVDSTENSGSYSWTITGPETTACTIKLSDLSNPDIYSIGNLFSITGTSSDSAVRKYSINSPHNTIGMHGTDGETPSSRTKDTKLGNGDFGDILNKNKMRLLGIILTDEQSGNPGGDKVDNSAGVNHGRSALQSQGFAGMSVPYQS